MVFAVSHLPMSPPPVTGPVPHVREMNEIKDLYVAQAEHAAKRARDELTAYSSMMVDERRRFVDPATVTHATAQYEAQLSHQQLQHSSELQTLRKQVDEARMETAVTVDQLRQNHEAVTQLAIASHRDSMAKAQAEHEDNLQHALARQHEGHSMAIVDLSEKHRLALASIERHWMEKVEQLHSEHAALLNQIQASNDMRLKQLEGDHSLDMQFLQEKEIRDRAGQVSMVNEKLRAAEAATLHLQVQIADLTAKLEGTAAQLRATELQALQAKEGMESNLRGLMVAIDDERAGRQAAEARLQTALGDSQRRMAELTDAHRLEMQQTHDANARLVQALNDDLRRVQETETLRQMEAVKHSRQLELDVSRFEDRLQQQLADELHAINAKHAQQLAALQQDMAVHAAAQSEQTAEAASRVFAEKMRAAEAGSHQQLAAVEADCALKLRALEAEVVRLQHDLAAQKELATLDLQGCQQLLGEKHQRAMAEARGEFEARLQGLAADADAACRKRERDLLLHNETEKLAAVAQCRTHATEVQLRDRHCLEKLEADNKQLAADNIALAERRTADEQAFATATTDLMRQMERLHTELELVKRHASDEVRGELDRLEADREALVRDRDSVLGRMSESMKAQMHAADDERAVLVGRLEQQRQEAEHRIRGDVAALETDYHAKLQEAHARVVSLEAQLASVGHKPVDFALHPAVHPGIESLPAVNILRTNTEVQLHEGNPPPIFFEEDLMLALNMNERQCSA
ncbi:hypothetical protein DIPPA_29835 [Diplonema papillatum]|nr:hypothetical protein DIPPA_29835 [Diplonema papillatum]